MEALCVVLTVVGIIIDEKNDSGVRHDNHLFRQMAWIADSPGPLGEECLAYARKKLVSISREVAVGAILRRTMPTQTDKAVDASCRRGT